jgi:hypothetical protein
MASAGGPLRQLYQARPAPGETLLIARLFSGTFFVIKLLKEYHGRFVLNHRKTSQALV